jgi:arylsulfatase A
VLDGHDLTPVLSRASLPGPDAEGHRPAGPRNTVFFIRGSTLYAVRHGAFKGHLITRPEYTGGPTVHDPLLLYDLDHDPSERFDVASQHPDVLAQMRGIVEAHGRTLKPVPTQMDSRVE